MRGEPIAVQRESLPGVIDSLSAGFRQINQIPWVVALPIGLDLALWRLPRLSALPLVNQLLDSLQQMTARAAELGAASQPAVDGPSIEALRQSLAQSPLANLAAFTTWNLAGAGLPSLVPGTDFVTGGTIEIGGFGLAVGLIVLLQLVGIALGCLFLGLIGCQLRGERATLPTVITSTWRYTVRAIGYTLLFLGAVLAISLPISLVVGLAMVVAPGVGSLLYGLMTLGAVIAGIWALFYLYFVMDAIVIGELAPLAAIRRSVNLVRTSFGASFGLIALTLFISLGMQVIWSALTRQSWGLPLAIIGNAYVASGLAAASMSFYRTRTRTGLPSPTPGTGRIAG